MNHPDEAETYSTLKDELAKKYPYNIEEYIKGKDYFIKEIDQKATKER
ncbi:GrpB family protein [Thermoanaerobacter wiegelii]|nr:GrpB family protein [Thermoanaerobacter wiegelii]